MGRSCVKCLTGAADVSSDPLGLTDAEMKNGRRLSSMTVLLYIYYLRNVSTQREFWKDSQKRSLINLIVYRHLPAAEYQSVFSFIAVVARGVDVD